MNRNLFAVFATLVSAGTAQAQLKSKVLPLLDVPAMRALAPTVKSIRAEPNAITIHVGQTVQLETITVFAVDSSGRDVARLGGFDFGIAPGGPAVAVPRHVTGTRVGTTVLTIHYSMQAWLDRHDPRPAAAVKIDVKP